VRGRRHAPAALYAPEKTRYQLYRTLGGPQGRSGQVRKISPPTGIRSRTGQPVASRYTDYATRPTGVWSLPYLSGLPRINNSLSCAYAWRKFQEDVCICCEDVVFICKTRDGESDRRAACLLVHPTHVHYHGHTRSTSTWPFRT